MKNKFEICEAVGADIEDIEVVAKESFDDYSRIDYSKMIVDPNYEFIVAKKDGVVVGFLIFLRIDTKLEIIKIATWTRFMRRGIATMLINKMINYGKENGHLGILLEVNEKNFSALSLYNKLGFKQIHVRKKYYHNTDDAIIMELLI